MFSQLKIVPISLVGLIALGLTLALAANWWVDSHAQPPSCVERVTALFSDRTKQREVWNSCLSLAVQIEYPQRDTWFDTVTERTKTVNVESVEIGWAERDRTGRWLAVLVIKVKGDESLRITRAILMTDPNEKVAWIVV